MWETVKTALVELLWPILKDVIKKYSRELIEWLVTKIKEWVESRNSGNADVAMNKAATHDAAAKEATTDAEAEKHKAVAQAWREVAEMFRKENEVLTSELQRLRTQAESDNIDTIEALSFDDAFTEKDGTLKASNHHLLS